MLLEKIGTDGSEVKYLRRSQLTTAAFDVASTVPVLLTPIELAKLIGGVPAFDDITDQRSSLRTGSNTIFNTSSSSTGEWRTIGIRNRSGEHSLASSTRSNASGLFQELSSASETTWRFPTF